METISMGVRDEGCLAFYMGWFKEDLDMVETVDLYGVVIRWKMEGINWI